MMKKAIPLFITILMVLLFDLSVVHGITWTKNRQLTHNAGRSGTPAIAVDGPNIYVVWYDTTPGTAEIYFKRSLDGGVTWTADKRLTRNKNEGGSYVPAIAVDGPNIYVVWHEFRWGNGLYGIYFKRSLDGGVTWTADKRLTNIKGNSLFPAIAVDGPNIYVVWYESINGPPKIYFKRSIDGGGTWTANKSLINTSSVARPPDIGVDGSNIYVVWGDMIMGHHHQIYFKRSIDGGSTWKANKRLTNTAGVSCFPDIGVDGSNIFVVWSDNTPGNAEIYFKRSIDGGGTWKANQRLTRNPGDSYFPAIAVNGSNIYVVWYDYTSGNKNPEIYFKRSIDGGVTWKANKRLTSNVDNPYVPAIAVNDSSINIVWSHSTQENSEIYFKNGVLY